MRFFVGLQVVTYLDSELDSADELRKQIVKDALSVQKIPLAYFQQYFANGGSAIHLKLGDLNLLVDEINKAWSPLKASRGENLVSGFIMNKLKTMSAEDSPSSSTGYL